MNTTDEVASAVGSAQDNAVEVKDAHEALEVVAAGKSARVNRTIRADAPFTTVVDGHPLCRIAVVRSGDIVEVPPGTLVLVAGQRLDADVIPACCLPMYAVRPGRRSRSARRFSPRSWSGGSEPEKWS